MVKVVYNPRLEPLIPSAALERARKVEHDLATGQLVLAPTTLPSAK
jgi:hypothetical protein